MFRSRHTTQDLNRKYWCAAILAVLLGSWAGVLADPPCGTPPCGGGGGGGDGGGGEAPRYTPIDLGSWPEAVNDLGQVVGSTYASGVSRAFLLNPEDADSDGIPDTWFRDDEPAPDGDGVNDLRIDLGTLGGPSSLARFINYDGQVVGWADTIDGDRHAFLWTPDDPNGTTGAMIDLGTLGGGLTSAAASINDFGQVVGWGDTDGGGNHAFLWTPDVSNGTTGTMIDLGALVDPMSWFDSININDSGQVVGPDSDHPFLWTPDSPNGTTGTMIDLGTLRQGRPSWANSINDFGQIAGSGEVREGTSHAFLITPEDTDGDGEPDTWFQDAGDGDNALMTDLGTVSSLNESLASSLNNAGQVVGQSYKVSPLAHKSERTIFLWEEGQGMQDLNDLIEGDIDLVRIGGDRGSINNEGQIVTYGGWILLPIP